MFIFLSCVVLCCVVCVCVCVCVRVCARACVCVCARWLLAVVPVHVREEVAAAPIPDAHAVSVVRTTRNNKAAVWADEVRGVDRAVVEGP